jgi:hypothetical protein
MLATALSCMHLCHPDPRCLCCHQCRNHSFSGEKEILYFLRMVLNVEQQKLIFFSYNHKLNESQDILKIEVIVAVNVLSLATSKCIVQAMRAKPKHTSCPNQATPGCTNR